VEKCKSPTAKWLANFRDLGNILARMAVTAKICPVTGHILIAQEDVDREWARLEKEWQNEEQNTNPLSAQSSGIDWHQRIPQAVADKFNVSRETFIKTINPKKVLKLANFLEAWHISKIDKDTSEVAAAKIVYSVVRPQDSLAKWSCASENGALVCSFFVNGCAVFAVTYNDNK
jgi:sigma54-dependent transcription regulator